VILLLGIGCSIFYLNQDETPKVTFEECENMGGGAWLVDLYHPDICTSCTEYRECELEYNDYREECPECYGPCQECQKTYSLQESCPECYGPCQSCENKYLHEFENDSERYILCPECEICESCRDEIEAKKSNCLPCESCNECKEKHKRYSDIREVCPEIDACSMCMSDTFPYPNKCPDGREKIGEISDAATWFMCCR